MLADRESRVFNDRTEWMLHQDIFQELSMLWGPFEIDQFTSRLNKRVCIYVSWKADPGATAMDAFSIVWDRNHCDAFPPFSLIHRCQQKITTDKAEGVIIVPMWPTQTYYSSVMSMLFQRPRLLQRKENLLRLPHSQKSHPSRLVFTSDGVGVRIVIGVIRELMTQWKSNIGVVSGDISSAESESEESERFHFFRFRLTTPSLMIQWKLDCGSRKQKRKTQSIARPGIEHCHWFILPLLLATPTMQFSLHRKRRSHKQNQCSASDSVGLIFTRTYRFTLLITTPTTTTSLVKTSLYGRKCSWWPVLYPG